MCQFLSRLSDKPWQRGFLSCWEEPCLHRGNRLSALDAELHSTVLEVSEGDLAIKLRDTFVQLEIGDQGL